MIRAARAERHKRHVPGLAACLGHGAGRQHKALGGKKNNRRIAIVLMRRCIGIMVVGGRVRVVVMVVCAHTLIMFVCVRMLLRPAASRAIAYVPGERIGEMAVMMRVIQAVHQRDVGLPGQHERKRHAEHRDSAPKRGKSLPVQHSLVRDHRDRRQHLSHMATAGQPSDLLSISGT